MKLPSCIAACFGGCARPPSETESSQFSVGKGPVSSGTVLGGVLSSFMSRRSGSRGTWEYSASDAQKPRVRGRGDADVVTLATARYLELFATTPKNDEMSTVLSEVREPQDSLRSARTASENQVSRSSTFTIRASREPSRLGAAGGQQQQQQPPGAFSSALQSVASQRLTGSAHRRGASDGLSSMSPSKDGHMQGGGPCQPVSAHGRRSGTASHGSALSPFTNKTRGPAALSTSRCRSDRISPSTAAYLLPAPSIRAIARAHTAIPATAAGMAASGGMSSSISLNDLTGAPAEGSGTDNDCGAATCPAGGTAAAAVASSGRPGDRLSGSSSHMVHGPGAGGVGRRSRLYTESGGTTATAASVSAAGAATGAGASSISSAAAGLSIAPQSGGAAGPADLGPAAQQWVQSHNQLTRSSTVTRSTKARRTLPRRPSILFTRDGDVTVTGLPPSCLTAGRAPRCRVAAAAAEGAMQGTMMSSNACYMSNADVSAPLCRTFLIGRSSMDSSSTRSGAQNMPAGVGGGGGGGAPYDPSSGGGGGGKDGQLPIPAGFLASPSNDAGGPAADASGVCLSMSNLRHGRGSGVRGGAGEVCTGVSMSCGANAMLTTADVTPLASCRRASVHDGCEIEGFAETERDDRHLNRRPLLFHTQQQQEQVRHHHHHHHHQAQEQQQAQSAGGHAVERAQQEQQEQGQETSQAVQAREQTDAAGAAPQPQQQLQQEQQQQPLQPQQRPHQRTSEDRQPERTQAEEPQAEGAGGSGEGGSRLLAMANSSSEGQRCDWGGSSVYAPSRFSDSSRLTQGNMTGAATHTHATASVHSTNPLEPCSSAVAAASATATATGRLGAQLPSTASVGSSTVRVLQAESSVDGVSVTGSAGGSGGGVGGAAAAGATARLPLAGGATKPLGPSLLAKEARDVTSALSRLQEACMVAVAQGDLRSTRLCRRVSTDLPLFGFHCGGTADTTALMRIGDGAVANGRNLPSGGSGGAGTAVGPETFGDRGTSGAGPSRIHSSLGSSAAQGRPPGGGRPSFNASSSLCRQPQSSLVGAPGGRITGSTGLAPSQAGSVTLAFGRTLMGVPDGQLPGPVPEIEAADGEPWGAYGGFGGDRPSPEPGGIVLDGAMMLERARMSVTADGEEVAAAAAAAAAAEAAAEVAAVAGLAGGGDAGPSTGAASQANPMLDKFEDPADEFQNRVLNVLLRSDFLHESYDGGVSEDEDDGVVEYRYGGFELGGGDNDCGFARQASFLEALRKCGAANAAPEGAAADAPPAPPLAPPVGLSRSASIPAAALSGGGSRPGGATLQRKGSCLAPTHVLTRLQ